jgi:hypothetical protein
MSIESFLAHETELVLQIAREWVQKILEWEDITHEEHMSIIEMWLSLFHISYLQNKYGSKTICA